MTELYPIPCYNSVCYCKSRNFRENFLFVNSSKRHICEVKNFRLGHDLPISFNDRVVVPFQEDSIFTQLCICEVSGR